MQAHSTKATQLFLTVILFTVSYNLSADVYRWKDRKGIMHYSDRPPVSITSKNSNELLLKIVKTDNYCANPAVVKASAKITEPLNGYGFFSKIKAKVTQKQAASVAVAAATSATNAGSKNAFKPLPFNTVTPSTPTGVTISKSNTVSASTPNKPVVVANISNTTSAVPTNTTSNPTTNTQINGLMPVVDITKTPFGDNGYNTLRVKAAQHDGVHNDRLGAFRTGCAITHYSNDDPIVYPGVKGAAHHHTFFGNTSANYKSTPETMRATGNSSCSGGIANRTGYWMPSIIDTATGAPLKPFRGIIYYKAGLVPGKFIQPFPKHLRMIAGDANVKTITQVTRQPPHENGIEPTKFACVNESASASYTGEGKLIPACKKATVGRATNGYIRVSINFPQCWDGKNLDSPDHKSHMAYSHWEQLDANGKKYYPENRCPTTHPIPLPQVTEIFDFEVTDAVNGTDKWRLASDNYPSSTRGGLSLHADWMNGWDEAIMSRIVKNCLNKDFDCGVDYLGDGQSLY